PSPVPDGEAVAAEATLVEELVQELLDLVRMGPVAPGPGVAPPQVVGGIGQLEGAATNPGKQDLRVDLAGGDPLHDPLGFPHPVGDRLGRVDGPALGAEANPDAPDPLVQRLLLDFGQTAFINQVLAQELLDQLPPGPEGRVDLDYLDLVALEDRQGQAPAQPAQRDR